MSQELILHYLRNNQLFAELDDATLQRLAQVCTYKVYKFDEGIFLSNRNPSPVMLIADGCIAVQAGRNKDAIVALVMPQQLLGEFEFFGFASPDNLSLFSVAEKTTLIEIPSEKLKGVIYSSGNPRIVQNLASLLITKININNFHVEAISISKGATKLAVILTGYSSLTGWMPSDYKDTDLRSPMCIPTIWNVSLITKYLSADHRTIKNGFVTLLKKNLITMEWLDNTLHTLTDVVLADLEAMFTRNERKINKTSPFRITINNPQKLSKFAGLQPHK